MVNINYHEIMQIPLPTLLPSNKANSLIYENGLSKIFSKLTLTVHSKMEDCFLLWDKFSKKQSLFDLWDFRYSWWQGYRYTPFFYTVYEGTRPLAMMPLWFDTKDQRYEWFGSDWMEDNEFFVADRSFIPVLINLIPKSFHLNALEFIDDNLLSKLDFIPDADKFIKDISKFSNIDDYLLSINKKHRYNLKKDYQAIMDYNPKIEIVSDNLVSEFKNLVDMQLNRFDDDEESDLVVEKRVKTYEAILKNTNSYKAQFIKVSVQSHLAAIDLVVTYKDTYYTMKGANDLRRFPGVGNFMVYLEFKQAIEKGFKLFDCLQIDYGWKHKYYDSKKLYIIEKNLDNPVDVS